MQKDIVKVCKKIFIVHWDALKNMSKENDIFKCWISFFDFKKLVVKFAFDNIKIFQSSLIYDSKIEELLYY